MRSPFKIRAEGASGGMVADGSELRRAITLFADPQLGFETVLLTAGIHRTHKGDDVETIARDVELYGNGIGVYFRFNPVPLGGTSQAKADSIVKRSWVFIDVDPVKPQEFKDYSATNGEKARTMGVADSVVGHLAELGWPMPVICDSGNGIALFYKCDLNNDAITRNAIRGVLNTLSGKFSGPDATIDKSVHNANRLAKLPGTWARKGTPTEERPHRPAKILFVPELLESVTFEQLQDINDEKPPERPPAIPYKPSGTMNGSPKAYARKALDNECMRVVMAQHTDEGRNNALNRAAFSTGQLVAGGELIESEVEQRLYEAACAAGLDRDKAGDRGIRNTIKSGLTAGKEHPRTAPERPADPKAILTGRVKAAAPAGEAPLTVGLSTIKPAKVDWLVRNRIPMRFITVFAGRTGVGKSFISHDLIARLSVGGEIPGGGGECFQAGGTLILSEDSHEYVLVPRLMEAGADLTRIHAMTWESMAAFHLGDTDMLSKACGEVPGGVKLVMIDPPTNFLADTDEHSNSEVRQLVMRVVDWAFKRDSAILFILHVNKQTGKGVEALNRVMGSVAWVTTARIAHTFCVDPDDSTRCLWVPLKNNIGELGKALGYRINKTDDLARVEWLGEVDMTADEAMGHQATKPKAIVAAEWLIERFRERLEWDSDDLFATGNEHGVKRDAIFAAKTKLNIPRAKKRIAENGDTYWVWWVPADWPYLALPDADPTVEPNRRG